MVASLPVEEHRQIYLFCDNARYHKSNKVKQQMDFLKIIPVWNVPYHYEFNEGIEKYWRALKGNYRRRLL